MVGLLDGHYTLLKPRIQVGLAIPHDVATQFEKWNAFSLTSPLRQRLVERPVIAATSSAVSSSAEALDIFAIFDVLIIRLVELSIS